MKNVVVFLIVIAGLFLSCSDKEQVISFNDFDRLITTDSIESIQVNNDGKALITKRYAAVDNENLMLLIPSAHYLGDMLHSRYPDNKVSHVSFVKCNSDNSLFMNLFPIVLMICLLVLFLISAIDILKNRFESDIDKLIWIMVVILVPMIGPILYLVIGRNQKLKLDK